ncbi:MAG: MATE family efflux transporter, partial [Aristaeellaceae bacterium]
MLFSREDLKRLLIPLLLEQLLAVLIGIMDTVMVSSCGEAAVSGVSLVDSINVLLIAVFSALATGGAVLSSQYLGKQDRDNAGRAAKMLFYVVLICSMTLMAVCLVLRDPLLSGIFGAIDADVMKNAQIYFLLSALSYP